MDFLGKARIRSKILSDPYYRFRSLEEIAIATQLGIKINVSQASVDDWLRIPGISIHQAKNLVELVAMGVQLLSIEDIAAAINISVQHLKAIEPLLEFSYYDPESLLMPQRINPNTATIEQLLQIPFITPTLAQTIVSDRLNNGTYRNLVDLQRRLSLDSQLLSQLMYYLQF